MRLLLKPPFPIMISLHYTICKHNNIYVILVIKFNWIKYECLDYSEVNHPFTTGLMLQWKNILSHCDNPTYIQHYENKFLTDLIL